MAFLNIDSWCLPARQAGPRLHCSSVMVAVVLLTSVGLGLVLAAPLQASEMRRGNPFAILAGYGVGIFGPSESAPGVRIDLVVTSEVFTEHSEHIVNALSTLREPFLVNLFSLDCVDDDMCSRLASIANLVGLRLPKDGLSPEGFTVLAGSPFVRELSLDERDMTTFDMTTLRSLKSLNLLELNGAVLSAANWEQLKKAGKLESLSCEDVRLTPDAWSAIRSLPRLKSLVVGGRWLTGKDIEELSTIPGLEKVSILNARLSAEDLRPLARLPRCTVLDLSGSSAQRYSLDVVADIKGLRTLQWRDLADLRSDMSLIQGRELTALGRMEHLAEIDLSDTRLDDEGLRAISALTALRKLKIERCHAISDAGLSELAALRQLDEVHVSGDRLTSRGVAAVARLPSLRVLTAYGVDVAPEDLAALARLGRIEKLALSFPKQSQSLQSSERLMAAIGKIASLRRLTVTGLYHNKETLAPLLNLQVLEELDLYGSQLDENAVRVLGRLRSLQILRFCCGPNGTCDSVDALRQLPQLQFVSVDGGGEITDDRWRLLGDKVVVRRFPEGQMKLRNISISGEFEDGELVRVLP